MSAAPVAVAVAGVLGVAPSRLGVRPVGAGGNSRVFLLTLGARRLVAKHYYRDASDKRDRLHAEWSFLEFAARTGIKRVPRPVARDERLGIGVYEFMEGRHLVREDVTVDRVREAAEFFLEVNARRAEAHGLPEASEACFSVAEHLQMVDGRMSRLAAIGSDGADEREAREFMAALGARWRELRGTILDAFPDARAEVAERCVSPSDFGFHNALLGARGLGFLDFEYAGWDDPAKMAGDFFAHPGVPVPQAHFDEFLRTTMGFSRHAAALEARARSLQPLFRIKWCCIMLNEFVPEAARRRRFASPGADEAQRKQSQLDKARALLASI